MLYDTESLRAMFPLYYTISEKIAPEKTPHFAA